MQMLVCWRQRELCLCFIGIQAQLPDRSFRERDALMPWFTGIAIVMATDVWVALRMHATDRQAPGFAEAIVVIVLPGGLHRPHASDTEKPGLGA